MLGEGGPDLLVEELLVLGAKPEASRVPATVSEADEHAAVAARRSFQGKGKTVFFREMMEETTQKSAKKLRWVIWSFVGVLVAAVGGLYWYSEQQARQTGAQLEEQRQALAAASQKTDVLASALKRAEAAMAQQQAAGDSAQKAAQGELARLQGELSRAASRASASDDRSSRAVLDSLRAAIRDQEKKNATIAAQVRAVKGV